MGITSCYNMDILLLKDIRTIAHKTSHVLYFTEKKLYKNGLSHCINNTTILMYFINGVNLPYIY